MLADQALDDGDLGAYKEHIDKARDLVKQAIALDEDAGSRRPSAPPSSPSGTETP